MALARANLMRAFAASGLPARWQEHRIGDREAPARVRGFGSPTILVDGVDGVDVAGSGAGTESCCRIYSAAGETAAAPSVGTIAAALKAAARRAQPQGTVRLLRSSLGVLPGLSAALLPKGMCPPCWPAYAAVLSATGLTFLMHDPWLLPISAVLLSAALIALGWRAKARRGYGPALAGMLAGVAILVGKFALDSRVAIYGGITALVFASIWNAWPRRALGPSCSACVSRAEA